MSVLGLFNTNYVGFWARVNLLFKIEILSNSQNTVNHFNL
jgi:hypothetical protein